MDNFRILHPESGFNGKVNSSGIEKNHSLLNSDIVSDSEIITSVFEHSRDIRPLLTAIRLELLKTDDELTIYIKNSKDALRHWQPKDFTNLLQAAGMTVKSIVQKENDEFKTVINCHQVDYDKFLKDNRLPSSDMRLLLATTEHPDYRITGGIGSYIKERENLSPCTSGILLIDLSKEYDDQTVRSHAWMSPQRFLSQQRIKTILNANYDMLPDIVLETLESIQCLYPFIEVVESQEMLLEATIRAKRVGLYPSSVQLTTVCHGSSFHLARARQDVLEAENIHVSYKEKYTIEQSDVTYFPTKFLKDSYKKYGVQYLEQDSKIVRRLPFDYKKLPQGEEFSDYKRLMYIGKTSSTKGFDLFLETLQVLYDKHRQTLRDIEDIVVVATSTKVIEPRLQDMYRKIEEILPIRMISLRRDELMMMLSQNAKDTLALITYKGDNHPLTVLELMAIAHDFIAADAGGTPELIPGGYATDFLSDPDSESFAEKTAATISAKGRPRLVAELSEAYRLQQESINKTYSTQQHKLPVRKDKRRYQTKRKVVVYILAGDDGKSLQSTEDSLHKQHRKADKIIMINSTNKNDEKNIHAKEDLVMKLHAGDVLATDALYLMEQAFEQQKDLGVCFAYELCTGYSGSKLTPKQEFHPVPPQLGSVFLQEKHKRRCIGMFKGELFDITNPLPDWHKAISAACLKYEVFTVPRLLLDLASIHKETTGIFAIDEYTGSFKALPLFDAQVLYSELKRLDDIYWGHQMIQQLDDTFIRRDDPSISYNIPTTVVKIVHIYNKHTPKIVKKILQSVVRLKRLIK